LKLVDWLGSQSMETLEHMYQHMQPILEHNYNLLMSQSYTKIVQEIA